MPVRIAADPGDAPLFEAASPQEFARAFRLTPEEAVDYLKGRARVRVTYDWHELWQDEHARTFTVSRLTRADLLEAIRQRIEASVNGDLTRRDFLRDVRAMLKEAGWWGENTVRAPDGRAVTTRFTPRRLQLIYDVNTRMAYAAGRWERIQAAKESHPYLRYVTRADERVRQSHRPWHNVTLPVDDSWWKTHYPPCGWRCRCTAVALRAKDVEGNPNLKRQAPDEPPVDWQNPVTGEVRQVPYAIDPGFGYNVGDAHLRWRGLIDAMAGRMARWPCEIGAAYWDHLDALAKEQAAQAFAAFFDDVIASEPQGRMAMVGAMRPGWLAELQALGARPATAEIMIRDVDLWHMRRDRKDRKLPDDWLRALPLHVQRPAAVLLDRTHKAPALLLLFDAQAGKLLVKLDYRLKKPRAATANILRTGAVLAEREIDAMRGLLGKGLDLLDGTL